MARIVKQPLPQPPPVYDQAYVSQLAAAINQYMIQAQAPAEVTAARFILVDPLHVPGDVASTAGLPTGMMYLGPALAASADSSVIQQAWATGGITLTTASQLIPGASVTISRSGTYLLIGTYDFTIGNEQGALIYGSIVGAMHNAIVDSTSKQGRTPASQFGVVNLTAPQTLQLHAWKTGGSGNSSVGLESSIVALWVAGPPAAGAAGAGPGFLTVVGTGDV
jgi:hypothetical protein